MARRVSPREIARFKASAKKEGLDVSHLTDRQIAGQIRILRGGLHAPLKSEIDEILERSRKTEQVIFECRSGVRSTLERALLEVRKLDRQAARRPKTPAASGMKRKARKVIELHQALLAFPPSLLGPEAQEALEQIQRWASLATKVVNGGNREGERVLSSLKERLESIVRKLAGPAGA